MKMRTDDLRFWPTGLIGMIALVIAVEIGVAWNETRLLTLGALVWRESGRAATGEAAKSEIVCFGDSLVMNGLAPTVIERRLGRRAYNLAVPRGQAAVHLFLLRRMLRAGARPTAILLDGDALDCNPIDDHLIPTWPFVANLTECAELAWSARDLTAFQTLVLARFSPSFRYRAEIRDRVVTALAGTTNPDAALLDPLRRNLDRNRGAFIFPDPILPPGADIRPGMIADYQPSGWSIHPLNARFLIEFLNLADSRGIPVFWLLPPAHPGYQAQREKYGHDASYTWFVQRLQHRYPRLIVIDGRHAGYDPSAVADLAHLNRRGAIAYSDAVAGVVGERLAAIPLLGSHWVALPAYREGQEAVAVEDLKASGDALRRIIR